ncbi:MAG: AMP-binding protein [Deltaproteobacteria bacterium]|nr:AMP-binding protein [Deltaproteobacteria bacterium]
MTTMRTLLERVERHFPANPALVPVSGGPTLTWGEFVARIRQTAGALRALGVEAGDRFAILCRNDPRQAELIHAGYWMGAVPVPINYRLAPVEITAILEGISPRLVAVEDHWASRIADPALAPYRDAVLWIGREHGGMPGRPVYEDIRDASPEDSGAAVTEDDDALLLYTGGTTGLTKGVRLTHRNIVTNGLQLMEPYRVAEDDVMLHVAPMFHSADLLGTPFSLVGAAHVYLPNFTPDAFLAAVERGRASFTLLSPTMIIRIIRDGRIRDFDISSLRRITYGAAPIDTVRIRRMMETFPGVELVHSYGLTETSPILTTLGWNHHLTGERLPSVGRPLVRVDLRIVDDEGDDLPVGEAGEIAVRGPNVSPGYLDRPDETAAAFRDGWFFTGDVGRLDDEGFLHLLDRKKDIIITGGENVWSSEVEAVLNRHPDVMEAAVIGVPQETWGETVLAVIVSAPGSDLADGVGKKSLIEHCRRFMGGYKVPRRYRFVDELPKSPMGKVLKAHLRRRYSKE